MRLYSCKVRLSTSLHNEVQKYGVTAPEVIILQRVHSTDPRNQIDGEAVVEIKQTGTDERSDVEERQRLMELYGPVLARKGIPFTALFAMGLPLPDKVDGAEEIAEKAPEPVIKRGPGRPKKKDAGPEELALAS